MIPFIAMNESLYVAAFAVATTLGMLLLLKLVQRFLYPHPVAKDLNHGNVARRLVRVGQVLAIFLVAGSVVKNGAKGENLVHDITWVAAFGAASVVLVSLTGRLGVQVLLQSRLDRKSTRLNSSHA